MSGDDFVAVQVFAAEIFGDAVKAETWFSRSNRALRGSRPADLLASAEGCREVRDVLGRLAHGVFS
ncbi:MAG TPA: MbcA/ParS/Xre antitoxin family protein [Longimicrobiaceae bacterium]|nr:MbcA/ParS/Xre antitoxin family protein [Longimicrobiaceae bacterium]